MGRKASPQRPLPRDPLPKTRRPVGADRQPCDPGTALWLQGPPPLSSRALGSVFGGYLQIRSREVGGKGTSLFSPLPPLWNEVLAQHTPLPPPTSRPPLSTPPSSPTIVIPWSSQGPPWAVEGQRLKGRTEACSSSNFLLAIDPPAQSSTHSSVFPPTVIYFVDIFPPIPLPLLAPLPSTTTRLRDRQPTLFKVSPARLKDSDPPPTITASTEHQTMNTDSRQDVELLLAGIVPVELDYDSCDTGSSFTPPRTPLDFAAIHVDMVNAHYLSPGPHHDTLRDSRSCSSGPSRGPYTTPELDQYSAVRPPPPQLTFWVESPEHPLPPRDPSANKQTRSRECPRSTTRPLRIRPS